MKTNKKTVFLLLAFSPAIVFGHGDETHEEKVKTTKSVVQKSVNTTQSALYEEINKSYLKNIKPIFEKKCFDCHADPENTPWYYTLPGIKQMMNYDMREAKEHMDMRKDFPFISHESPLNDLKSIQKIGMEGGMPPLRYILGHWDSRLTDAEKKEIISWSTRSIKLLKSEKKHK
ncbi:heme-binding domain-containing protein [Sulfurovum sp. ST-21]|uniref:Heme-binding domain-containing protein n=1 Tax=Sulfurovum indicum TaxID=2779528 RepID=A0A7M1S1W1_9BACT|nr:heme-binding domain-containing protein [Sulfurovum indicum]QOR61214.1 heme-binding domain-containing protein [Sulfurovum indicum]